MAAKLSTLLIKCSAFGDFVSKPPPGALPLDPLRDFRPSDRLVGPRMLTENRRPCPFSVLECMYAMQDKRTGRTKVHVGLQSTDH